MTPHDDEGAVRLGAVTDAEDGCDDDEDEEDDEDDEDDDENGEEEEDDGEFIYPPTPAGASGKWGTR